MKFQNRKVKEYLQICGGVAVNKGHTSIQMKRIVRTAARRQ